MQKVLIILTASIWLLCSCAEQYNISGDSTVSTLDGRLLYLKVMTQTQNLRNLDSCEVVHGKFNFMGFVDSTCMGELCMDNESVMPIVLENGKLNIRINNMEQRVSGGTLNNKLYHFLEQKNLLENQILELSNQEARLILSGEEPEKIHIKLGKKSDKLYNKLEKLETDFIVNNSDNVLGSTFFMLLCSQYPYPQITPQIKQIISTTSKKFRRIPFVQDYMKAAESNMRYLQHIHQEQNYPEPEKSFRVE